MKETVQWPPKIDTAELSSVTSLVMRQTLDRLHRGPNAELLCFVLAKIYGELGCQASAVVSYIDQPPEGSNGLHYLVRLEREDLDQGLLAIDPGYLWLADLAEIDNRGLPSTLITSRDPETGNLKWPTDYDWPTQLVDMIDPAHLKVHNGHVDTMRRFGKERIGERMVKIYMQSVHVSEPVQN